MIPLEEWKEEAKQCDGCLDWHHHCNAECCRTLSFTLTRQRFKLGDVIKVTIEQMTADKKWYYELHGCVVEDDCVIFKLGMHKWVGNKLIVFKTCEKLVDNLCSGHPHDKPEVCKALTLETKDDPQFHLTDRCLFRFKEVKNGTN